MIKGATRRYQLEQTRGMSTRMSGKTKYYEQKKLKRYARKKSTDETLYKIQMNLHNIKIAILII